MPPPILASCAKFLDASLTDLNKEFEEGKQRLSKKEAEAASRYPFVRDDDESDESDGKQAERPHSPLADGVALTLTSPVPLLFQKNGLQMPQESFVSPVSAVTDVGRSRGPDTLEMATVAISSGRSKWHSLRTWIVATCVERQMRGTLSTPDDKDSFAWEDISLLFRPELAFALLDSRSEDYIRLDDWARMAHLVSSYLSTPFLSPVIFAVLSDGTMRNGRVHVDSSETDDALPVADTTVEVRINTPANVAANLHDRVVTRKRFMRFAVCLNAYVPSVSADKVASWQAAAAAFNIDTKVEVLVYHRSNCIDRKSKAAGTIFLTNRHLHFVPMKAMSSNASLYRRVELHLIVRSNVKSGGLFGLAGCALELDVVQAWSDIDDARKRTELIFNVAGMYTAQATLFSHYIQEMSTAARLDHRAALEAEGRAVNVPCHLLTDFAAQNLIRTRVMVEHMEVTETPLLVCSRAGRANRAFAAGLTKLLRVPFEDKATVSRVVSSTLALFSTAPRAEDTEYALELAAEEIEEEAEDHSLSAFRDDVVQFFDLIERPLQLMDQLDDLFAWRPPGRAAALFTVCIVIFVNDWVSWLLPIFSLILTSYLTCIGIRLRYVPVPPSLVPVAAWLGVAPATHIGDLDAIESSSDAAFGAAASLTLAAEGATKEATVADKNIKSPRGVVAQWNELKDSLTMASVKYRKLHGFFRANSTTLIKARVLLTWQLPERSMRATIFLAVVSFLLCLMPVRYVWLILVLHLFTQHMAFRRDPSPVERFWEEIPVREELEQALEAAKAAAAAAEAAAAAAKAAAEEAAAAAADAVSGDSTTNDEPKKDR
jgi:hypothetical protein